MSEKLGHVVIDGDKFPIEALGLHDGEFRIFFRVKGPHRAVSGPITVFGSDGRGCWQGRHWDLAAIPRRESCLYIYGMRMDKVDGAGTDEVVRPVMTA